jgi:nucleotide-binding universal stress UspA family protein
MNPRNSSKHPADQRLARGSPVAITPVEGGKIMTSFRHILFPVDFSKRCLAATPYVMSVARQFKARLTLLHVIQNPIEWYGGVDGLYPIPADIQLMIQAAKKRLDAFLEAPEPSAEVDTLVEEGDPADCITFRAEQQGVDLIMMPTHGNGLFRNLLIGSVTAKVLHDAKCAVWTAAHTPDPQQSDPAEVQSILCAVDLKPESVNVIRFAHEMADVYHAKLRLVNAVPVAESRPEKYLETDFREFLLRAAREEIARLQKEAGTQFDVCMEGGSVSSVIKGAAYHHDADLLIIGRGGHHNPFGRLRSNSYAIIRDSPCPVLSV